MRKILLSFFVASASIAGSTVHATEYSWSPQLAQVGVDQSLQSYANYGKGIVIGIVDTGINSSHNEFSGRISTQSTCVATGNCSQGFTDTFGHGTFVASLAAGALNGVGMVGVAPQATILSVKIAQSNGMAYTTDENSGIIAAAQRGAKVINLSYGSFFGPSDTSAYAAYNAQLVSAINYAASKGSTIVIAGGNSSKTFIGNVDVSGFTASALSHLIFAGAVNANNVLSSYSNTAGTTNFVNTTGQKTALSNLWLMAPGDNLIGAWYQGTNLYAQGSGTSFAAPIITGALALLDARWPVLFNNGTTAQVLLQSAKDLGAAGTDTTYGVGLMDVNKAFLPIGALNIKNAQGQNVSVSSITGSMLSSGAFGSLNSIRSILGNMTSFDSFQRDYAVNLSGLIATRPSAATIALPHGVQTVGSAYHFADGSSFGYSETTTEQSFLPQANDLAVQQKNWYMSMTSADQATMSAGYGYSASASFAEALWGHDSMAADGADSLGISNGLMNLASGGMFASYGFQLSDDTRLAASWGQTATTNSPTLSPSSIAKADAFGIGVTTQLSKGWSAGFTFNTLDERDGLLGSTYANSPLGFGTHHNSQSVGVSSAFALSDNSDLLLDAAWTRSDSADIADGLITHVSEVYAHSFGASFVERDAFKDGDRFSLSVKKPMQVSSGSATLATTSVDENGYATTTSHNLSLKADGSETDFGFTYSVPTDEGVNWSASLQEQTDANNTPGQNATSFMVSAKLSF